MATIPGSNNNPQMGGGQLPAITYIKMVNMPYPNMR